MTRTTEHPVASEGHCKEYSERQDENDKAIAQGGTFELTRVAYWGPNTGKVNTAVSQAFERIFLGEQTVEEAFEQAQEEIQAILEGE